MTYYKLIPLSLALACFYSSAYSDSQWNAFLQVPTEHRLLELKKDIPPARNTCADSTLPNPAEAIRLIGLVSGGNELSFRAGLLISHCLGVGDLEDFYRASGAFLDLHPKAFLRIVTSSALPEHTVRDMVTMLPLTLVDNYRGTLMAIDKRIATVKAVDDPLLNDIKAKIVTSLQDEKLELETIESDRTRGNNREH